MSARQLSLSETDALNVVRSFPGEIEYRLDCGVPYWYLNGQRAKGHAARALKGLLEYGLIEVKEVPRRTVGLREPRIARAVFPRDTP